MVYRKPLRSAKSNPNAEFMGFELLNKYNDEHPDELHLEYMKRQKKSQETRGRRSGTQLPCKRCGRIGHYAKTCKHTLDYLGRRLTD